MKEIYADFNNIAQDGSLALTCAGSVASIEALDRPLADGEEVLLSDGELRAVGRVVRRADGTWDVLPGWRLQRSGAGPP